MSMGRYSDNRRVLSGAVQYSGNQLARALDIFVPRCSVNAVRTESMNRARGKQPDNIGSVHATFTGGPHGQAATHTGGLSNFNIFNYPTVGADDFAFACHIRTHTSISGYLPIAAYGTFAPGLYQSLSGGTWGLYHGANINAATSLSASTWYTLVATRRNGTVYYYKNGAPDGSASYSTTWGSSAMMILFNGSATRFLGSITWFGFWRRGLQAKEAEQLHRDPWVVLRPRRRKAYPVPAAPPGGFQPAFAVSSNVIIQPGQGA